MDTQELLLTALRAFGVYAIILIVVRLAGKRTIGNFTPFDLLVALMLGEVVDEIIYGDVTFVQGLVAIVAIGLIHQINAWLSYWGHGFDTLFEGKPTIIVKHGQLQLPGMRKERMNEHDVMSELRLRGIKELKAVRLAVVENDGQVSVIRETWAEPAPRGAAAKGSAQVTRPAPEPPAAEPLPQQPTRTDSKEALG